MANRYGGARTICPYYIREANKSITCEGMIPGTMNQQRFDTERELLVFQRRFCCTPSYRTCPVAASLGEKWGDVPNSNIIVPNSNIFPDGTTMGQKISILRRRAGMTQGQLARAVCVSRSLVAGIESGWKTPSIPTLMAIATVLEAAVQDLIGGEYEKP